MNEEYENWKNEQWRGAVNAIPRWEGVWNTITGFLTSAETAKIRLHGVVAQDRKACECGAWKKRREGNPFAMKMWDSPNPRERKLAKDTYRWTIRR